MRQQEEILKGLREQQQKQKERELARLSGATSVVTNTSSLMTAHGDRGAPKRDHKEPLPPPPKNVVVAKGDLKQKLDRRMDTIERPDMMKSRNKSERSRSSSTSRSTSERGYREDTNEDSSATRRRRRSSHKETSERSRGSTSTSASNGQSVPARSVKSRDRSSTSSLSGSTISSAHMSRGNSTIHTDRKSTV